MKGTVQYIAWFKEVDKDDVALVGGKGANLGEMVGAGFNVPNGFIITSHAYFDFLKTNKLDIKIKHLLNTANFNSPDSLNQVSALIKREILSSDLSPALVSEILKAYKAL